MTRSRTMTPILTAGLLLLVSGTAAAEAPTIRTLEANSPGYITISWEHSGEDAEGFLVQREEPAFTWEYETPVGMHTDKNLQPGTLYKYRACAVYADTTECSEWFDKRTHPPESPPAHYPKPPPTVTKHESYHEPSRIKIWWKKNGKYERVIVLSRHKSGAGQSQVDVDGPAWEGSHEVLTPLPGTYVFILKGCTLNFVGAANCGDWSAPKEVNTAPPGVARVDCIPGTLKSDSPRFAASGRAEYHFENPPPGYKTVAGACLSPERTVAASYLVHGVWNPTAKPGAWDNSDANTTETFILTFGDDFSPERAPRRPLPPDAWPTTATITFLTRAHCDRDPWLNANAVCRRTGNNVPPDIREKWPTLLTEPFPHSRNAIPAAERGQLLARYHQVTGQLVGTARPPVDREALAPKTSPAIQGQASAIETAPKQATAQANRTRTDGQNAQQQQSMVDPSADVTLNPQPLPPKTTVLKHRETVIHAPATQTRSADVSRNATPLQQSPLSKIPPELAAEAEGKELLELRCRGGDTFNFHPIAQDPAAARLAARNQLTSKRIMVSFLPPKRNTEGRIPSAGENGGNLGTSQCAFADREFTETDPPGIIFDAQAGEATASAEQYLKDPAHYWTFTAFKTNYGHFRAVRHGPWMPTGAAAKTAGAGPQGGVPADLFDQNDRAIIIVGGKQTTAGKLKAELRSEIKRESGAPQAVKTTSKHLAPAAVSQAAIQQTQVATTRSNDRKLFTHSQSQTIQGTAANNTVSSLQVDCNSQVPRIVQVRGAIKAGENFTIEGSCFGGDPGRVELIGLPSGKVTMPFTTWSEGTIAAMMPPVSGVQDQRLTMTVIRNADRKTSPPREVTFVAAKGVVPVPADRWSPSARFAKSEVRYDVYQRGLLGLRTDEFGTGRMQPGVAQMRAQINPACALEAMGTTPNSGGIRRIMGWENGPPHEANVSLEWYPGCTTRKERSHVTGEQWSTYICEIDFTVNATAYCPVGINP